MEYKLQGWWGKLVNWAGRSTQIQVVVNTMTNFQMGCMQFSGKTINKIDFIQKELLVEQE